MTPETPDLLRLVIGGKEYAGWTAATISRGLKRVSSHVSLQVSERWPGQKEPWALVPFTPVQVFAGKSLMLTGYLDHYNVSGSATDHRVTIEGRSRTADLIDCTPDIKSGQFTGYSIAAIAKSICALFKIEVDQQTALADAVVPNTNLEKCETAWAFLEKLCRLGGVLATDDVLGRFVLAEIGATRASSQLVHGQNIQAYSLRWKTDHQFSDYIVIGQAGLGGGASSWDGAGGSDSGGDPVAPIGSQVHVSLRGEAHDASVPRYRPRVVMAESQMGTPGMQARANWLRNHSAGVAIEADITVPGWRQRDGSLWRPNQLVSVTSPHLGVDRELLIVDAKWKIDKSGRSTVLTVGPVSGYTPDPASIKTHKHKGGHGGGASGWSGAADQE